MSSQQAADAALTSNDACESVGNHRIKVEIITPQDTTVGEAPRMELTRRYTAFWDVDTSGMSLDEHVKYLCAKFNWRAYEPVLLDELHNIELTQGKGVAHQIVSFLDRVSEVKKSAKIARLYDQSGIPKALLNSVFDESLIGFYGDLDVLDLNWIEAGACLYLTGSAGTGKTQTAVEIAKRAIVDRGYNVFYIDSTELSKSLQYRNSALKVIETCHNVELLIVDNLGFEEVYEGNSRDLYTVFNYRLDKFLPIVFISNQGLTPWGNSYRNDRTFINLLGKLFTRTYTLEYSGESFYKGYSL